MNGPSYSVAAPQTKACVPFWHILSVKFYLVYVKCFGV